LLIVLALLVASPSVENLLVTPQTTFFTEMGLLGVDHTGVYPSNISAGENNPLYFEFTNHLGHCAYYVLEIKFLNESQQQPDGFNHKNSAVDPLSSMAFFVADNKSYELPLDVSFQYSADAVAGRLYVQSVTVNDIGVNATGTTLAWNFEKKGYFGNLVFELYIYNDATGAFQYHERFVNLWLKLNM
jgi:hypothetical protein